MAVADALASHVREGGSPPWTVPSHWLEALKMIDWVPIVFVTFKVLVFGTAMFFAIKWHYDQGKKKGASRRELLIASGKIVAVLDRKSTRLNSSHLVISYAVFCLKKNRNQVN